MPKITINNVHLEIDRGTTVLEAARFLGMPVPTLCHDDGLTPYGACRLCVVEVGKPPRSKLLSACTLPVEEGLVVETHSRRVERARRLLLEMYVATSPQSKVIQDLASRYGVTQARLVPKHEDCIQCGLCVRMCNEQMMSGAIGFGFRGPKRKVMAPFTAQSEVCRQCGGCMYICPLCMLRCQGASADSTLCNGCLNFDPQCMHHYDHAMCSLDPCVACEIAGPLRQDLVWPAEPDRMSSPKGETP